MSETPNQPGLNSLSKSFEPAAIEAKWGPLWEERGYARAGHRGTGEPRASEPSFAIQLPPPNVTGTLHMGHAFNQTIMDSLTRYHRMRGFNTLWVPGTDHAGIATQIVVERQLQEQGQSRHDLGRKNFVAKVWEWKEQSGNTITTQMRRMGDSVDWSHEYFTMDDDLSQTVTETFVRLYEQGLIYRGKRLVNWDPELKTAVSDLEVVSEEEDGFLWHISYPLVDGSGVLTVATTRPETMLGDVAVMVHPEDERYRHLIGKQVRLPLCDRDIPVIADEYVDKEFGTGVVKVTPAHDANDYAVGQRHKLPIIGVLTLDAKINENAPAKYRGLDRFVARKQVVADLEALGLLAGHQEAQAHRAAMRAHGPDHRADAHRPVVRRHDQGERQGPGRQVHRAEGHRRRPDRRGEVRAGELGQHLQPVDEQHPGLVHLAPAVVGPPDPRLVRRGWQGLRRPQRSRGAGPGAGQGTAAGRGRAGHLVFVGAGAVLHAGLAREDEGPRPVPAFVRAGHRLRHHLLLGGPDDHDDDAFHRAGALPPRVHPRPGARLARQEDEQVGG